MTPQAIVMASLYLAGCYRVFQKMSASVGWLAAIAFAMVWPAALIELTIEWMGGDS